MKLYICEKPSQGRSYAEALNAKNSRDGYIEDGNGIYITWCFGHLLTALDPVDYGEEYKKWGLKSLPLFPKEKWGTRVAKDKVKQYKVIKSLVDKADEIYIASDADREGEAIVVSLLEKMGYQGPRKRVWTGALDAETIRKAIKNSVDAKEKFVLYEAADTRMKADWIHGINLTRAMTVANQGFMEGIFSVGRVQTAVLNMIVKRDFEIENFKAKDYYEMSCLFNTPEGDLKAGWNMPKSFLDEEEGKCLDKDKVKEVVDKLKGKDGEVTLSEKTRKKEAPPLLFSLSGLQKECNKLFGYDMKDVLDIAQSLYETHKATTYPRTDCEYINMEQFELVGKTFKAMANSDPSNSEIQDFIARSDQSKKSKAWNSKKVTAHHAIVPNIANFDMNKLSEKEKKVYDLIRRRYIAQFFPDAESDSSKLEITCEGELFKLSGSMPVSAGWKEVIGKKAESKELPPLKKGDKVTNAKPKLETKKTKPPARYNDASLLEAMINAAKFVEDSKYKKLLKGTEGIGTEATRAGIVDILFQREYVKKQKKNIISTEKGRALIEVAPEQSKSIELTAYWESQLEKIANGELRPDAFLADQETLLNEMMDEIKSGKCTLKKAVGTLYSCPKCEAGLRQIKSKKNGKKYWVCGNKETCNAIYQDNRGKPAFPKKVDQGDTEHTCEVCKENKLTRRISKNNKFFWTCDGNECDAMYFDNEMIPKLIVKEEIDQGSEKHQCPHCKKADLIRKKGQYGMYWNCPSCKKNCKEDADTQKPILNLSKPKTDYKCPNCKEGYLVERNGKKGKFFGCNNFPKCKTIKSEKDGKPEGF